MAERVIALLSRERCSWPGVIPATWTRAVFTAELRYLLPLDSYSEEECPSEVRRVGGSWELVLQPATAEHRVGILQHLTGRRGRSSCCSLRFEDGPPDPSIRKPFWERRDIQVDELRRWPRRTGTEQDYDYEKENADG